MDNERLIGVAANPHDAFDMKEYVEAANDAANRTRYVSIVLMIATILILVGLNNSYMNSWMVEDLREVYKPGDRYVRSLFQHNLRGNKVADADYFTEKCDDQSPPNCVPTPADKAKKDAQEALMKIHLEGRLFIKIPILGVSIHVNDLGLIGGITLIVLLLLQRTSLSREIKNLNYSFKKAYEAQSLDPFYDALAMRQLFTVPHMKGEKRNRFLSKTPYVVCVFPVAIYLLLVAYDVLTAIVIPRYRDPISEHPLTASIVWLMVVEGICGLAICFIALRCVERQHYIYSIWDGFWKLLKPLPELCFLESAVASRLENGRDYSILVRENNPDLVTLSEEIVADLKRVKTDTVRPARFSSIRWLRRAFREEAVPIFHFVPHAFRVLLHRQPAGKPLLVTIGPDLAELFSNDKELNDTLRQILKKR